jgi:hypothetical protein
MMEKVSSGVVDDEVNACGLSGRKFMGNVK